MPKQVLPLNPKPQTLNPIPLTFHRPSLHGRFWSRVPPKTVTRFLFFAGFLGLKGALKFHHQIGFLSQSYYDLGPKTDASICHLCSAGVTGVPFEELADSPTWESTLHFVQSWKDGFSPPLTIIPYDPMCTSALYRLDAFHCWKVGLGRDLTGSAVVILAHLGKFDFAEADPRGVGI